MDTSVLTIIKEHYDPTRLKNIDTDFLEFEENSITELDQQRVLYCIQNNITLPNNHNSIILYLTGVCNQFDFDKERCDHIDGSEPD